MTMAKGLLNWGWLDRRMEKLGLSYRMLGVSRETLRLWDGGAESRPFYLKKLADSLGVSVGELVRKLGVKPMRIARRKAIGRQLAKARKAAQA